MSDPALDLENTSEVALKQYLRDFNEQVLTLKPGQVPTKFKIARLSRKQFLAIGVTQGQALTAHQQNEVVALCLKGVENWGTLLNFELTGNKERVSEETLNQIYAPSLWYELASVAVGISGLRPLDG